MSDVLNACGEEGCQPLLPQHKTDSKEGTLLQCLDLLCILMSDLSIHVG